MNPNGEQKNVQCSRSKSERIGSLNCQLRLINYFDMKERWNEWPIQFKESKNWNNSMTCHIYHSIWLRFCGKFAIRPETFSSVKISINKRNGSKRNRMSREKKKNFHKRVPLNIYRYIQLHFPLFFQSYRLCINLFI